MFNFIKKIFGAYEEEVEAEELSLEESRSILLEILNTIKKIEADNPKPDLLALQNGTLKILFDSINYQLIKDNEEAKTFYFEVKSYFIDNKMM